MSSSSSDNHEGEIQINAEGELIWQDTTRIQFDGYGDIIRIDDGTVSLRPNYAVTAAQKNGCCCPDQCNCNAARSFFSRDNSGGNPTFNNFSICGCTSKTMQITIEGVTSGSYSAHYISAAVLGNVSTTWNPNGTHCLRLLNADYDPLGYERDIFSFYYAGYWPSRVTTNYTTDHSDYSYNTTASIEFSGYLDMTGLSEETGGDAKIMAVVIANDGYTEVFDSYPWTQIGTQPVSGNDVRQWNDSYTWGRGRHTEYNPPLTQNNNRIMRSGGICDPDFTFSGALSSSLVECKAVGPYGAIWCDFSGYGGSASLAFPGKTDCKSCDPVACPDGDPSWNCVFIVLTWLSSSTDAGDTWSAPRAPYVFLISGSEAAKYPAPSTLDYGYGFTVRIDWDVWKISQGIQGNGYCQAVRYQLIGQADPYTQPDLSEVLANPPTPVAPGTRCVEPSDASSSSSSSQSEVSSSSSSYSTNSSSSSDRHLHGSNPDHGEGSESRSSWSSGSSNSKSSYSSVSDSRAEPSSSSDNPLNSSQSTAHVHSSHSSLSNDSVSSSSHSSHSSLSSESSNSGTSASSLSTPIESESGEGECTCYGVRLKRPSATVCAEALFLRGGDLRTDADGRTYTGTKIKRKECHRLYIWDAAHHDGVKWVVSGTPTIVRTLGNYPTKKTAYDGPFYVAGAARIDAPYWDENCGIGGIEIMTDESWTPTTTELTRAYSIMSTCGTVPTAGDTVKLILYVRFSRTNTDPNSASIRLYGIHATCGTGGSSGACCTGTYTVTATGSESSTYTLANNSNGTWGNFGFASSGRWTLDIAPVTDDGFPWEGKWRLTYSNDVTGIGGQWYTPVDLTSNCADVSSWTYYEYPAADGNTTGFTSITLHCNSGGGTGDNSSSSSSVSSHSSDPEGCVGTYYEWVDYSNNRGVVDGPTAVGVAEFDARGYRDEGWQRTGYSSSPQNDTWYRIIFICEGQHVPSAAEIGPAPRNGGLTAIRHMDLLEPHPLIANRGSGSAMRGAYPVLRKPMADGDSRPLRGMPPMMEMIDPSKMPSSEPIAAVVSPQLPKVSTPKPCGSCSRKAAQIKLAE